MERIIERYLDEKDTTIKELEKKIISIEEDLGCANKRIEELDIETAMFNLENATVYIKEEASYHINNLLKSDNNSYHKGAILIECMKIGIVFNQEQGEEFIKSLLEEQEEVANDK
jgi:hypothetical protein